MIEVEKMKKKELELIFKEVREMITECIKKGLSAEMILIEGLPNLQSKYGLDAKYYEDKLKQALNNYKQR